MNNQNFMKAAPQYMANVAMKVNAKLGGSSCFVGPADAKGQPANEYGLYPKPVMYIGADVSHAPRQFVNGVITRNPSLAAVTCSIDKVGAAYSAKCFTQPGGLELMDKTKLQPTIRELFQNYGRATKKVPETIFYIRDGVSEGQYGYILTEEVKAMEEELLRAPRVREMKVKVRALVRISVIQADIDLHSPSGRSSLLENVIIRASSLSKRETRTVTPDRARLSTETSPCLMSSIGICARMLPSRVALNRFIMSFFGMTASTRRIHCRC